MTELRKPARPPRQSRTTRRVTLNVDEELLREAGEFLGTTSMTETINGALDEYVQSFFPYRHGAVSDWLVDSNAALLTSLLMWALWSRYKVLPAA